MNPFHNRGAEWELYTPLVGKTMLELGNKRNGEWTYKRYFESLGHQHMSVDINGLDGALPLDLTKPLTLGTFDMISNIGTSEHVTPQAPCWRNMLEAMHIGSVLVSTTPKCGHWQWHGEWYPYPRFYHELCALNGLAMERLYISGETPRQMWFCRAVRATDKPFVMPDEKLIYFNRRR